MRISIIAALAVSIVLALGAATNAAGRDVNMDIIRHCSGCNMSGMDLHGRDLHGVTFE